MLPLWLVTVQLGQVREFPKSGISNLLRIWHIWRYDVRLRAPKIPSSLPLTWTMNHFRYCVVSCVHLPHFRNSTCKSKKVRTAMKHVLRLGDYIAISYQLRWKIAGQIWAQNPWGMAKSKIHEWDHTAEALAKAGHSLIRCWRSVVMSGETCHKTIRGEGCQGWSKLLEAGGATILGRSYETEIPTCKRFPKIAEKVVKIG